MTRKFRAIAIAAIAAAAFFAAAPQSRAEQFGKVGCFNFSGVYMLAEDQDLYYDFAGISLRLGFYPLKYTELFVDFLFAGGLDLPDYLDYAANLGAMAGLTQYVPLSDNAALYVRGRAGVIVNTWEYNYTAHYYYDSPYIYDVDDEEEDTYFAAGIGAGISILLSDSVSLEVGYDYLAIDDSNQFDEDYDIEKNDDWAGYHMIHAGLDIRF